VPDPDVMPDNDPVVSSPLEEFMVILLPQAIGKTPVAEVMKSCSPQRMILRIYPVVSGYGAEFSYLGVHDVTVIHYIAIIADVRLGYMRSRPDSRPSTKSCIFNKCGRIYPGFFA
jgi:hypothetical protein